MATTSDRWSTEWLASRRWPTAAKWCSTRATADLVHDYLPTGVGLRDVGKHFLKDLARPEEVFQLEAEGLTADFPPLRSLHKPDLLNNLPELASTFVGRDVELTEVRRLVEQSRLVTLTGAGGAGKTRLALQVGAELLAGSGEGVWLVELAAVGDPEAVPGAVASSLGLEQEPGREVSQNLVRALASQRRLVILDNCEHLIGACAKLTEAIVRGCPKIHLMVTSREPLGIDGEHVFRVPSLSLPPPDADTRSDMVGSGAVSLFVERAGAQASGFVLSEAHARTVAAICRRLDGMPLAIELAASRLRSMALSHLHDRLDQQFRLLTGGSRNAMPRQQTLRALVDWSYDLLTEIERTLFRRLSVFAGGFELEAAEVLQEGDIGAAASNFIEALRLVRLSGDLRLSSYETLGLALCASASDDVDRAVTLHGGAAALLEAVGATAWERPEEGYRERDIAKLRTSAGSKSDHFYEAGFAMSHDEIVDLALAGYR